MATIYQLQITSNYNILACHSATSATVDYKLTTRTHYHNISASNYIRLQYFGLPFSNLSNCQLQEHIITIYQLQITSDYNISACHSATSATVNYKNTLSQYISFKLHPTTIFWLAIQQPQQLSTTRTHYHNISASNYIRLQYFGLPFSNLSNCQLQEHIITIYQLQITSNYNILACHSATSATVNYKNTLSQYISFKLHPTTIFRLAIQQPQQLSTTSLLQEHIITI